MQENEKNKRNNIEKVRMILDNPSIGSKYIEDEKHLKDLKKRLINSPVAQLRRNYGTLSQYGSLEPQVSIHKKEEEKVADLPEFKEIETAETKISYETKDLVYDEELFEVEKVELDIPEFIEVKPLKPLSKEEQKSEAEFTIITDKEEIQDENVTTFVATQDENLPEWQPVETDQNKFEELKTEEFQVIDKTYSDKIEEEVQKELSEEQKAEEVSSKDKIELFKEIHSIDKVTALILYDNGFDSIEKLKNATIKDLINLPGIKRKVAKSILKEITQEQKLEPVKIEEIQPPEITVEELKQVEKELRKEKPKKPKLSILKTKKPTNGWEPIDEEKEIPEEKPKKPKLSILKTKKPTNGWEPIEEEPMKQEKPIEKTTIPEEKTEIFKEIQSINPQIEKLLTEHGIKTKEQLKQTTIKELTKIKGIKKSTAKQIKKELKETQNKEKIPEWEPIEEEKVDLENQSENGYKYSEYKLYKKEVSIGPGKTRTVHFFSKEKPEEGKETVLPPGFEVEVNNRTGVPYLRKKK